LLECSATHRPGSPAGGADFEQAWTGEARYLLMDVSLMIPTYNRANLIGKTIPALASQVTGDFTYEVIFVSNGSSDNTVEVLKEAAKRYSGCIRYYSIAPT